MCLPDLIWLFPCLPDSTWAGGNLAEQMEQWWNNWNYWIKIRVGKVKRLLWLQKILITVITG